MEINDRLNMEINRNRIHLLKESSTKLIRILDIHKLLDYMLDIALQGLDAERGTVYIVNNEKKELWSKVLAGSNITEIRLPIGKGIAGTVAKNGRTINIKNAYKDKRFNQEVDKHSGFKTESILCMAIKDSSKKIVGVFQILNKRGEPFGKDDREFLNSLSNYAAVGLEMATLHEELVEKKRLEHELKIARDIQVKLLPKSTPVIEGYELFGNNISCEQVSGDYYDFIRIAENKWILTIGDVSGKGIPASLLMAVAQSHLEALVKYNDSILEIITTLNEHIVKNSTIEKYITFFFGLLDTSNNTFEYVNAGHNPPVYIKKNGSLRELKTGGPIIGMFPNLSYKKETLNLDNGDVVFCFTDGVNECMNTKEEEYGEERLYKFLQSKVHSDLRSIFDGLMEELNKFSVNTSQSDDITVLMLKRK